ncbi:hypothetical protein [Georgenia alba]|uniref:DUF3263 domain-containing protein n=1 Tax=Georgenia alba TaxID=2233858 RepID=A0ABW2Q7Y5_9MICO
MNPYIGETHDVLARIHHEELLTRAAEIHQIRELRRANRQERAARRRQRRAGLL